MRRGDRYIASRYESHGHQGIPRASSGSRAASDRNAARSRNTEGGPVSAPRRELGQPVGLGTWRSVAVTECRGTVRRAASNDGGTARGWRAADAGGWGSGCYIVVDRALG